MQQRYSNHLPRTFDMPRQYDPKRNRMWEHWSYVYVDSKAVLFVSGNISFFCLLNVLRMFLVTTRGGCRKLSWGRAQ
ncbi:hypothetical protein Bca101_063621 [Brassica carinata]